MNPYLKDFLIEAVILAIIYAAIWIPYNIWHKNHLTPYEKKMKERFRKEFEAEQAAQAATQQPQPRQPKPGSVEDYERWKAERLKQQQEEPQ